MNNRKRITLIKQVLDTCRTLWKNVYSFFASLITGKKTFDDLVFADHANVANGLQATLTLGRNTEISVVSMKNEDKDFGGLYGNASKGTYEVAVFRNNQMLPLSAFDDVLGWQTKNDISELMANFQGKSKDVDEFTYQLHNKAEELRQELLAD